MLFALSPAKTLDFTPAPESLPATRPELSRRTEELARTTRTLAPAELKRLMGISDKLAELNAGRFRAFKPRAHDEGVQAALAFAGDVYEGLDARSLSPDDLAWAQDRVRILSGLYGVLRPLDRIQPYRLEMGTRLATGRGADLYGFWGADIAKSLNAAARGMTDPTLVNLASQEYFGAVDRKALKLPVVACTFKEEAAGALRIVSFYAKRARGLMARFAVETRAERVADLRRFDRAGYRHRPELSSEGELVFTRPHP